MIVSEAYCLNWARWVSTGGASGDRRIYPPVRYTDLWSLNASDSLGVRDVKFDGTAVTANAADFKTSFETTDPQPAWSDSADMAYNQSPRNVSPQPGIAVAECSIRANEQAHTGNTALMYSGNGLGGTQTYLTYKTFGLTYPVSAATTLSFWIYPQQDNARYVAVDLHCTDGRTLRDSTAKDQNGISMHPNQGHGGNIPLNAWTRIYSTFGPALAGCTIDKMWVNFDRPGTTGIYRGYIDDVELNEGKTTVQNVLKTGFEANDPQPTWNNSPDTAYNNSPVNVTARAGVAAP